MSRVANVLIPAVLVACACRGPTLQLDNPGQHRTFVDGVEVGSKPTTKLPFRYYGTTRWDALPADVEHPELGRRADWDHLPASETVAIDPPASLLLFPFDFGVELVVRLVGVTGDQTARIAVPETPPDERVEMIPPDAIGALGDRARAARRARCTTKRCRRPARACSCTASAGSAAAARRCAT